MTTDERQYELEDASGQPISFTGVRLATASSRRAEDERLYEQSRQMPWEERERWLASQNYRAQWMELAIYRTHGGSYILEMVGQTTRDGEVVRRRAKVLDTPKALIDALHNRDENQVQYITYTARDALDEAMAQDPPLRAAWKSRTRVVA